MAMVDPRSFSDITSVLLETFFSAAGKAAASKTSSSVATRRSRRRLLEQYLKDATNDVFYLTTYRLSPQHLDDAYVTPRLIDGALSQTYIEPIEFGAVLKSLSADVDNEEDDEQSSTLHIRHGLGSEPVIRFDLRYVPLKEVIEKPRSLVVLGEAGSGKSTLLAYICWSRLQQPSPRLPVFLSSRQLRDSGIFDHLERVVETLQIEGFSSSDLDEMLAFYVDGLDEVAPERYHELILEIGALRRRFPECPLIVSCRAASYAGELSFLQEVSVAPFDDEQSSEFVRRWFRGANSGPSPEDFLEAVTGSDRLARLTSQPLLLALMCNVYQRYLDFSRRQTTLFEQCVSTLLWQWDAMRAVKRKSLFEDLDIQKRLWLHACIAHYFHERRSRFLSKRELVTALRDVLPRFGISADSSDVALAEICSHHGLLVQWTEETFGFGHLALQEFLTAKWLSDGNRWHALTTTERLRDGWWLNVTGLAMGLLSDATDGIERILDSTEMAEIDRLRISAHCLRYDPILAPNTRDGILRRVLDLLHSGDASEHDAAMMMLVGIEDAYAASRIQRSLATQAVPSRRDAELALRRPVRESGPKRGQ